MTDIASLDAPALNRFIAEQLGWEHCPRCDKWYREPQNRHDDHMLNKPLPSYTTDPRALHEAEKVLREDGWVLHVSVSSEAAYAQWRRLAGGFEDASTSLEGQQHG